MAGWTSATALLLGTLTLETVATAQVVTFARTDYTSDAGARAIVAADLNRDGWLDLAHANISRNSVTVLLSHGGLGFTRPAEIPVGLGPFALTTADFNRDAIPDLAVANASGHTISILLGRGDGSFARTDLATPAQGPRGITAADVNNDGRVDLISTGFDSGTVQLWLGNGAGSFVRSVSATAAGTQPQGVAAGDFDHDAHLDAAVATAVGLQLYMDLGTTARTVRTIAGPGRLNVLAVGDLNHDGWADVAAASTAGNTVSVYLGGASGLTFSHTYAAGASPRGLTLADVNDDGLLDIVTANRNASTISLLMGDAAHPGLFQTSRAFAAAAGSRDVVTGDFDGDGRIDVATGNQDASAVTVLANTTVFKQAGFSFKALTVPSDRTLATYGTGDPRFAPRSRIAVADFNRDGKIDFVVPADPGFGSNAVVILLRDGPTVLLSGPVPLTSFLVDDFNGDGNADVVYYSTNPAATTPSTRFVTYLGDGHGHFAASATTVEHQSVERWCGAGDLNGDARPDLVCDNYVLLGNGNGTFRQEVAFTEPGLGASFLGVFFADVNRDGKLDVLGEGIFLGDGSGGLTPAAGVPPDDMGGSGSFFLSVVADLNHDGFVDLVGNNPPDGFAVSWGSAAGFLPLELHPGLEDAAAMATSDVNMDGRPDILVNALPHAENSGTIQFELGHSDGTFTPDSFQLGHAPAVVVADVNNDGLPDVIDYDAHAIRVLVNERNETNHPPVVPTFSVTTGQGAPLIDAHISDPDQHLVFVNWYDSAGEIFASGTGEFTALRPVLTQPGTYTFRAVATDTHGATASGTVTLTYAVTLKEIVLYSAADNVRMSGHWTRVTDPTAAGGVRAYDVNVGAPKVMQPAEVPANAITIPFLADQNLTYKLWIRLKAASDSWANDSVWVQFATDVNFQYLPGSTTGLWVSLEQCVGCGVSGWGWRDDGFGVAHGNGVLLQFATFPPGPQQIVIQTREDGVSIDQVVLSAERYLTTPPGPAKNDQTILAATPVP